MRLFIITMALIGYKSNQHRKFHCEDKTVVRYHNENFYTGEMIYNNKPQCVLASWHQFPAAPASLVSLRINTLRLRQNGRNFTYDIFKSIFMNENIWILINISLKFIPKGQINSILKLVQIMAWHRSGNKPLSEPMMVSLLMQICVTRRLNELTSEYWYHHNFHTKVKISFGII